MSDHPTAELAAYAAGLRFDDIPATVREHLALCLLDTLGCGLYGATLPWTKILAATVGEIDPSGPAAVWGGPQTTSCLHAAMINGAAVHGFELDDLHPASIVHPGSVVISAALAMADHVAGVTGTPVPGTELVTAIAAGYEVAARVGMSMGAAHLLAGWHPTGTHGTLGAAAAAGRILGLGPGAMQQAFGISGTQASGLMAAQYSSMVKRFHAGRAAQSGVYGALLAARGYTGISDLFESEYGGYCGTFSPEHDLDRLVEGLGTTWETAAVGFKPYSTNGSCHPAIDAILDLYHGQGLRWAAVDRIDIDVSTATDKHVGWPYVPDSVTTAQMNLHYIAAVALADGDAFVDQFTPERIADPRLLALSERVYVHADPDIDAKGNAYRHYTRLAVTRTDGEVVREVRERARGSAKIPLTTDEVIAKFGKLASKVLAPDELARLRALVERVADLSDSRDLTRAIVPYQGANRA